MAEQEAKSSIVQDSEFNELTESSPNNCRMYENKYPQVDDLVVVQVKNVAEMGAYVTLIEYGGIEGMILMSELSRRRIRSINKLIRVGRTEVVVVMRVDQEKGYIDLSKRRVSPEDIVKAETKFNQSKAVHSIMTHVSKTCNVKLEDLYTQFGWDLYKKFGHAYEAFKHIVNGQESILDSYNLRADVKDAILKNIKRRMTPQPVKVRADVEVTCFAYEGIDAIKKALKKAEEEAGQEDKIPVKIRLVAPPLYVLTTTCLDKDKGLAALRQACDIIKTSIRSQGGDLNIKTEARVVSERDDRLLSMMMETLEKQNQEVAGDDDDEEE